MKVFILGLDGATFDLLDPMMNEGIAPNLKALCDTGTRSPLMTIFPPVTGPAWLALATGLNPGKTGVFDYINRKSPKSSDLVPVSSAYYQSRALWDYLGSRGYKVGIYNYPTLSPPPKVNGFSVSGMGGYKKENLCYPAALETELQNVSGGYEVQLNLRNAKYERDPLLFLQDVERVMHKQYAVLRYLLKEKDWDFFWGVFHFTDWMQHLLWHHIDPRHPLHVRDASSSVRSAFRAIWQKIDGMIGEMRQMLPEDVVLMIVSDHGAGPLDSAFYANSWLENKGWVKKKDLGWRTRLAGLLKPLSADVDNKYFNPLLRILKTKVLRNHGTMELIDFENSLAYSPEHAGMFGCINLTEKGRNEPGFLERIVKELKNLPGTMTGVDHMEVYLPEDLYNGPYIDRSPDILFVVNRYRSSCEIDFARDAFMSSPSITMRTGGHLPAGVFMAHGRPFGRHAYREISVLDIVPTVLALYDMPIPDEVDGRVLSEALTREAQETLRIRKSDATAVRKHEVDAKGDLEEMKQTLESLGYM